MNYVFGNFMINLNPDFQPLMYAGGLYDSDTKLIRFGARDYDPTIGRWTTKDPIGLAGGLNQYDYGAGNPMTLVDPSGNNPLVLFGLLFFSPTSLETQGTAAMEKVSAGLNVLTMGFGRLLSGPVATTAVSEIPLIYSKHALERMVKYEINENMVETAIRKGTSFYNAKGDSFNYILRDGFASGESLLVGRGRLSGQITTVTKDSYKKLLKSRFTPLD
ncbi:MAG: RHS repeat-associated core domain-containing protein [Gammaproteobacteria bacterium]